MAAKSPTRWVNWEKYFNANKDAAQGEAHQMADRQKSAAEAARRQTQGLLGNFSQQATAGTVQAPAAQAQRATNVGTAAAPPMQTVQAGPGAASAPQYAGALPGSMAAGPSYQPSVPSYQLAAAPVGGMALPGQVKADYMFGTGIQDADANAARTYSGPGWLGGGSMKGDYDAAKAQANKAIEGLNLTGSESGIQALYEQQNRGLTSGQSLFGSALAGSAGRNKFDRLRSEFNLGTEWNDAEAKAQALAAQGTTASLAAAKQWQAEAQRMRGEKGKAEAERAAVNTDLLNIGNVAKGLGPTRVRQMDYGEFGRRMGGAKGIPAESGFTEDVYSQMSEEELNALYNAKGANLGERESPVYKYMLEMVKKYGRKG